MYLARRCYHCGFGLDGLEAMVIWQTDKIKDNVPSALQRCDLTHWVKVSKVITLNVSPHPGGFSRH